MPYNIALLGARAHIHYLGYFRDLPEYHVAGVYESDPKRAANAADFIQAPVLDSEADILDNPAVDWVFIAVDPCEKAKAIAKVAAAGKPIFMDKPWPIDLTAIARIEQTLAEHPVPLVVPFPHCRFNNNLASVGERVKAGQFGTLDVWDHKFLFHSSAGSVGDTIGLPQPPETSTGGEAVNLGCYALDFVTDALGLPDRVEARVARNFWKEYESAGTEDFVEVWFTYPHTRAHLILGRNQVPDQGFTINRLSLTAPSHDLLIAPYQEIHQHNGRALPLEDHGEGENCCTHFVACAKGETTSKSAIAAGRKIATVTTAIYQSAAQNKVIDLPLADETNPYLAGWRL